MDQAVSLNDAEEARSANWTIKNVPLSTRLKATTAARRSGKPVWQWLDWAVEVADSQQDRNTVEPAARANSSNFEGQPRRDTGPIDLDRLIAMAALRLTRLMSHRGNGLLGEALGVAPPPPSQKLLKRRAEMAKLAAPQVVEPSEINEVAA